MHEAPRQTTIINHHYIIVINNPCACKILTHPCPSDERPHCKARAGSGDQLYACEQQCHGQSPYTIYTSQRGTCQPTLSLLQNPVLTLAHLMSGRTTKRELAQKARGGTVYTPTSTCGCGWRVRQGRAGDAGQGMNVQNESVRNECARNECAE